MARENSIALSDAELEKLKDARFEIFNTNEVPYGAVVDAMVERVIGNE